VTNHSEAQQQVSVREHLLPKIGEYQDNKHSAYDEALGDALKEGRTSNP